ncbi:MAG: tRNA (adenosine(37)-N6)-threonylcarbamoyltransferase complex dimerization subunit type 1 TsaB [Erythrobacter sp.]|mgnify:CR=1 FL=1|nr:tRNA (adenosine(37)-N6)-threonylcarbamoyltransferase complex dimerization subunit type 1 TsaB [Erythrobacter sp.]
MRLLAIDTSGEACSVALFDGAKLIDARHETIGRGHAERLVPMIADLPENGRSDRIMVSLGPGSFTGVRIGLAAARALGVAWNASVAGYPTLSLIAAIAQAEVSGPADICMNGGHGEWFVQSFDSSGLPITEVQSRRPEEAARELTAAFVAGNRAAEFAQISGRQIRSLEVVADARFVSAIPAPLKTSALSPIYGRAPDAKAPGQ